MNKVHLQNKIPSPLPQHPPLAWNQNCSFFCMNIDRYGYIQLEVLKTGWTHGWTRERSIGCTAWGKDYAQHRSLTMIRAGDWSACSLGISCSSEDHCRADYKVTDWRSSKICTFVKQCECRTGCWMLAAGGRLHCILTGSPRSSRSGRGFLANIYMCAVNAAERIQTVEWIFQRQNKNVFLMSLFMYICRAIPADEIHYLRAAIGVQAALHVAQAKLLCRSINQTKPAWPPGLL